MGENLDSANEASHLHQTKPITTFFYPADQTDRYGRNSNTIMRELVEKILPFKLLRTEEQLQ